MEVTHLFNSIQHQIPDDCNLFFLAEADSPADGLGFDGRVPLGLDDVYPGCDGEVKAKFVSQQYGPEKSGVLVW